MKGKGYAASEQILNGIKTIEPCIAACHELKTTHPTTNGLTINSGGCKCKQDMSSANGADNTRSCFLREKIMNATGNSVWHKQQPIIRENQD